MLSESKIICGENLLVGFTNLFLFNCRISSANSSVLISLTFLSFAWAISSDFSSPDNFSDFLLLENREILGIFLTNFRYDEYFNINVRKEPRWTNKPVAVF